MRLKNTIAWTPAPVVNDEAGNKTLPNASTNGTSKLPRSLRRQARAAVNGRAHSQGFAPPRRVFQRHR